MQVTAVVKGAWDAFATEITMFLPKLIGALIIFIIGLVIARLVRYAVVKLLRLVRLDKGAEKAGASEFLEKGGILKTPSEIVGSLAYWFIMILVLVATLDALGLPIVSDLLNDVFRYMPSVVAAVIVLIIGTLLGSLLAAAVRAGAANAGLKSAEGLGRMTFVAIMFFAGSVALIQLGIGVEIVSAAFIMAFGALALALGLAFGLGGKDQAAVYLKRWLEEKKASAKG